MRIDWNPPTESGAECQRSQPPFSRVLLVVALGVSMMMIAVPLRAQNGLPPALEGVGIDQRLDAQVPLDLPFRDETGNMVRLGDYFGRRPVVLSLVYYNCPMLCTMVLNGLLNSLREVKFDIGDQFDVVTVSFDPRDKPEIAEAKKRIYTGLYARPGAAAGWHFLTGDEDSIQRLTQSVGFRYTYDSATGQFNHATAIMVLTPDGRVSRYFYGVAYVPRDLRLGLVEASNRKIGSPVDAVVLFCSQYNPATGRYGLVISRALQLGGLITLLALGALVFILFRNERHRPAPVPKSSP
ncbi:MAG: SCO family protein [Acidobacteriia bacterium]|nr:SCO family protein [Terriglobia bacterium]